MAGTLLSARQEMLAGRFASALAILSDLQQAEPTGRRPSARTADTGRRNEGDAEERDVQLIELLHATGHPREAKARARRFLPNAPVSLATRCEIILGQICLQSQNPEHAISHFQKAISLAKSSRDQRLVCQAQLKLLTTLADASPINTLSAQIADISKRLELLGQADLVADFHIRVAQIEAASGDFEKAKIHLSRARIVLRAAPNVYLEGFLNLAASAVCLLATELSEARECATAALDCAMKSGHAYTRMAATANLGLLELNLGNLDTAAQHIDEALNLSDAFSVSRISLLDSYALLQLARGRLDECKSALEKIAEAATTRGSSVFSWQQLAVSQTRLRYLMATGRFEDAYEPCQTMIRAADRRSDKPHGVSLRILGSDALLELGRFEEAAALIDEAEAMAEDVPLSTFAEIERGRAALIARTIGRDSARRQFERSLRVLSTVGSIAARMDAITSYRRSIHPTNAALTRALEAQPWSLEAVVASTLPGTAGHRLEEGSRTRRVRSVGLTDTMALGRLVRNPDLLAQEAFILLRESGHVVALASVQRAQGLAERVVANEGWSPEAARKEAIGHTSAVVIPVGTVDGRELELLAEPAENAQSRSFVRDLASFVRQAQSLQSYRDAEHTQLPLRSLGSAHDPDGVFTSESMRQLVATAKQVASSDVPILITGETGTGKEVLARLIHKHSGRAGKAFVPFNCTGVPKDMVESQLFGHRRGAFTGAREDSPGVIRAANGGTLLLDEVGEIEPDVQPKLLRFLDKAEVHPLGEPRPTNVNVRVIAATNANLDELVRIGRFREDLLYRLNIITLDLPPLRTRREEVLPLVHYFLQRIGRDVGRPNLHITEDAEKCLLCFEWPGNVRRLGNEMRRAVALAREDTIGLEHLSPEVVEAGRAIGETAQSATTGDAPAIPVNPDQPLSDAVAHLEHAMISRTLESVGGHMGFAAQRLGISRKGLYLKRQRLGLDIV